MKSATAEGSSLLVATKELEKEKKWMWSRTSWQFGVLVGSLSSFVVFIINLSIFASAVARKPTEGGIISLFEGSCERTRAYNVGAHVVINVLATVLLSASNYTMQCLSAPTRDEVDRAHAKRKTLNIGIMSLRNLLHVSRRNVALWAILGMSSLPLHLFYNSAIFHSISVSQYEAFFVSDAFIREGPGTNYSAASTYSRPYLETLRQKVQANQLERLDAVSCINAYANSLQSTRGSVLVVTDDVAQPELIDELSPYYVVTLNRWICGLNEEERPYRKPCQFYLDGYRRNISSWTPFGGGRRAPVATHCFSEKVPERCRLNLSVPLSVLVIVLSLFKTIGMLYMFLRTKSAPLLTMGDAVASFMVASDTETRGMCLATAKDIRAARGSWPIPPKAFDRTRRRWFHAVSVKWWYICCVMYLAVGAIVGVFLHLGIAALEFNSQFNDLWNLGIGSINPITIIQNWSVPSSGSAAIVSNALVANSGQVLLSFIYFTYNSLFTSMSLAYEWSSYALRRKGLRVSHVPTGEQRTTYFLQLPYRLALPLMSASTVLHWLLSQSIYLVNIQVYGLPTPTRRFQPKVWDWIRDPSSDIISCGYSPMAIILFLVAGFLMLTFLWSMSARKLVSAMPVVGSCSAAISAACHVRNHTEHEDAESTEKVSWGADDWNGRDIGHCSFSTGQTFTPEDGRIYAGRRKGTRMERESS